MNLKAKAAARTARVAGKIERPKQQLSRRSDLPEQAVPRFRVPGTNVTFNRQRSDERGITTRQPPRRTKR